MNSEDYGWKPEVSQWYDQALENRNNPDANIWTIIQRPENSFQTASWWLARKIIQDASTFELGYRNQIRHLVSREEAQGSFPFTQYIRELCQNALDSVMNDEHLTIELIIDDSGMVFSHDGRSFKGPTPTSPEGEMASLYAPGMTTKRGSFNSEGRFGIGFKGWMLFFEGIKHEHSDGNQKIQIGYRFEGDGYNQETLHLKGTEAPENSEPSIRKTSFRFSEPTDEFKHPSIEEIVDEWLPMIRFAHHGVTIKINLMGDEVEIIHEVNTLETLENPAINQEIFESFTKTDLASTISLNKFICTYESCEPIPFELIPDCPECGDNSDVERIPCDDDLLFQYCCTYDDCGDVPFSAAPDGPDSLVPDCPECGDSNDVIRKERITEERIMAFDHK